MREGFLDELSKNGQRKAIGTGPSDEMLAAFREGVAKGKALMLFCVDRGAKLSPEARAIRNGKAAEPEKEEKASPIKGKYSK